VDGADRGRPVVSQTGMCRTEKRPTVKMAIAVQGRFHAFHLACALLERGHDVTVLTNYPRWAAGRFGLPRERVCSFWVHGVLVRALDRLDPKSVWAGAEPWLHSLFGRWAARTLAAEHWDVVHLWSGIAEESLKHPTGGRLRLVMRGSSHVRTQARLLAEEERRTGVRQDRPSPWRIAREEREYAMADRIVVLSSFAQRTFLEEGIPAERLRVVSLGANVEKFRPALEAVRARQRRLISGAPLRVLYVGAMSFRKGLWDLAETVRSLGRDGFEFRFVGPQSVEARPIVAELRGAVSMEPKVQEAVLPEIYAWGDVFVFPSIEDGYAAVVAQAAAGALPILTTTNCAGPDMIHVGENGWIVPIRAPETLVERLRWCAAHRNELASMVSRIYERFQPRDWSEVAADFEAVCQEEMGLLRR
jgi:glycosyltransferase involved in cell wall biosynthesis